MKKFKHWHHFIPLFGILSAGFIGFFIFSFNQVFQALIMIVMATSYVVWGLLHHYRHEDLHINVIVEYIAVSFLGLVVILSVIFRA